MKRTFKILLACVSLSAFTILSSGCLTTIAALSKADEAKASEVAEHNEAIESINESINAELETYTSATETSETQATTVDEEISASIRESINNEITLATSPTEESVAEGDITYEMSYGTYSVDSKWSKDNSYTSGENYLFFKENDNSQNNINILFQENDYAESDMEKFRQDLVNWAAQSAGEDVTIEANGTTTANGYMLYIIHFIYGDGDTLQYYVMGDHKHVLFHSTIWDMSQYEEVKEVTERAVDSFVWAE